MNERRAKQLACREAALILDSYLVNGWSAMLELPVQDRERARRAMGELVSELRRRGARAAAMSDRLRVSAELDAAAEAVAAQAEVTRRECRQ